MSMPNIPNITPEISLSRCESIDLLLSSIALEEIALSHIMNAEGEKLQSFLKKHSHTLKDYWLINESVNKMLRTIIKSQLMLQLKLEDVVELSRRTNCCHHQSHDHCDCDLCRSMLHKDKGKCDGK